MLARREREELLASGLPPRGEPGEANLAHRHTTADRLCARLLVLHRDYFVDRAIDLLLLHAFPQERADRLRDMAALRPPKERLVTSHHLDHRLDDAVGFL